MSWVVYALLGVVAVALGRTVMLHQAGTDTHEAATTPTAGSSPGAASEAAGSAGSPSDGTPTCSEGMRMCTMEFLPKTCSVVVDERRYEAKGNNGCEANGALLEALCAAGVRSLTTAQAAAMECREDAIGESND